MALKAVASYLGYGKSEPKPIDEEKKPAPSSPTLIETAALKMESNSDKASYSLGFDAGITLRKQFGEMNVHLVERGFLDAVEGLSPALLPEEILKIIAALKIHLQQHTAMQMALKIQKQDEFFRINATEQEIQHLSDGIQYEVIEKGKGEKPTFQNIVTFHIALSSLVGKVHVKNTWEEDKPMQGFVQQQTPPGLAKALLEMRVGDYWKIFIPANQAFGTTGNPLIEPHTALVCEVKLLEIQTAAEVQQQVVQHLQEKIRAQDEFFKKNASEPGIRQLSDGIQYKIIQGGTGEKPTLDNIVNIRINTSAVISGIQIQNAREVKGRVRQQIPGLAKALLEMKVGDHWMIFLPPLQAYGEAGRPPVVEPHTALSCDVQLLGIE